MPERFVHVDLLSDVELRRVIEACVAAGLSREAAIMRACLPCPSCDQTVKPGLSSISPADPDSPGQRWHVDCYTRTVLTS